MAQAFRTLVRDDTGVLRVVLRDVETNGVITDPSGYTIVKLDEGKNPIPVNYWLDKPVDMATPRPNDLVEDGLNPRLPESLPVSTEEEYTKRLDKGGGRDASNWAPVEDNAYNADGTPNRFGESIIDRGRGFFTGAAGAALGGVIAGPIGAMVGGLAGRAFNKSLSGRLGDRISPAGQLYGWGIGQPKPEAVIAEIDKKNLAPANPAPVGTVTSSPLPGGLNPAVPVPVGTVDSRQLPADLNPAPPVTISPVVSNPLGGNLNPAPPAGVGQVSRTALPSDLNPAPAIGVGRVTSAPLAADLNPTAVPAGKIDKASLGQAAPNPFNSTVPGSRPTQVSSSTASIPSTSARSAPMTQLEDITGIANVSYELAGKERPHTPDLQLVDRVRGAVGTSLPGYGVNVVSGLGEFGSERHRAVNQGRALDFGLVNPQGQKISPTTNPEVYETAAAGLASYGIQGVGHYGWGMHADVVSKAAWGPTESKASLAPGFQSALEQGYANPAQYSYAGVPTPTSRSSALGRTPVAPAPNTVQSYTGPKGFASKNRATPTTGVAPNFNSMTAGELAFSGYVNPPEQSRIDSMAHVMAGELDVRTLEGLTKNDPIARAEAANVLSTMDNRSRSVGFDNVLDPTQYNSMMGSKRGVTDANFSRYRDAIVSTIQDTYAGRNAPTNPNATHYANMDIANPDWGGSLQNREKVGYHTFGSLPNEYQVDQKTRESMLEQAVSNYNGAPSKSNNVDPKSTASKIASMDNAKSQDRGRGLGVANFESVSFSGGVIGEVSESEKGKEASKDKSEESKTESKDSKDSKSSKDTGTSRDNESGSSTPGNSSRDTSGGSGIGSSKSASASKGTTGAGSNSYSRGNSSSDAASASRGGGLGSRSSSKSASKDSSSKSSGPSYSGSSKSDKDNDKSSKK